MKLYESGEMYLETILVLSRKTAKLRSVDICEHLGYSKPSVSRAVGILKKDRLISVAQDGAISLTAKGREIAEKIYEKHIVLTKMLVGLGVPEDTAAKDACKIEHVISEESFSAIKKHLGF